MRQPGRFCYKARQVKDDYVFILQSDTGKSLLAAYGLPAGYLKSVVYIKENKYYTRSSAVLNILKDLGGVWSLFYGFIIVPVFIRDFFYNFIAGIRYRIFGKKVSCLTPHPSSLISHLFLISLFSMVCRFNHF